MSEVVGYENVSCDHTWWVVSGVILENEVDLSVLWYYARLE